MVGAKEGGEDQKRQRARRQQGLRWGSAGLLVLLAVLYHFRPGITTAITLWPAWIGLALFFTLALFAGKPRWPLFLAGIVFGFIFVEEFASLLRPLTVPSTGQIKVITLNCAGGSVLAASEIKKGRRPSLVFFQESPSRPFLEKLAKELYGPEAVVAWGPDATIMGAGKIEPIPLPRTVTNATAARWSPRSGDSFTVVSLRLQPPVLRFDLWNPAAWQEYAAGRERRREEVRELKRVLAAHGVQPDLIGGDFNTPPDPWVMNPLVEGMRDAFATHGTGFGATCVNPYPCIVRIDQIWYGRAFIATQAYVLPTQHSDHRMMVAELDFRTSPGGNPQ